MLHAEFGMTQRLFLQACGIERPNVYTIWKWYEPVHLDKEFGRSYTVQMYLVPCLKIVRLNLHYMDAGAGEMGMFPANGYLFAKEWQPESRMVYFHQVGYAADTVSLVGRAMWADVQKAHENPEKWGLFVPNPHVACDLEARTIEELHQCG